MESFLIQATIYLLAAVVAVPIAMRLGLGSVLGYLIAGIVIGPVLGLVGSETQDLQHFAEFGVVMMLFVIGLELDPRALWDMRARLIGLGGLQIGVTTALITGAGLALDLPWNQALAIGLIFALSSTAIVLQTLSEKGLMQTGGGRSIFSVLLSQDIAVIPMLALLPLLVTSGLHNSGGGGHGSGHGDGHGDGHGSGGAAEVAMSFVDNLQPWAVTLVTIGAVAAIILLGIYATRPIFTFIHRSGLREMFTATALLMVVAIASLMMIVGLSPALGTFLAGVVLANSEFRHELESDIEPFKGLLLGLFFITVGAGINFELLFANFLMVVGLTLAIMAVKAIVLFALAMIFKLRGRDRILFTLGLAQMGEFGFVLMGVAITQDVLPSGLAQLLNIVIALSMLLTPLFFILYEQMAKRLQTVDGPEMSPDEISNEGPIIIAGIGRFGQVVNRMVSSAGFTTTVLDHDLNMIQLMRRFGIKGFFGDPTRPELLHAAGLEDARVLVVTLDDREAAIKLVEHARRERPDLHIVARAYDRVHVYELYQAGANDIVREMFDSSLRVGRYVLENMGLTDFEAHEVEQAFYKHDRSALLELAGLWKPGVPVDQNPDYVARAKELNNTMETAVLGSIKSKTAEQSDTPPAAETPPKEA